MGVGTHQGIRIGQALAVLFAREDPASEKFQVDLMHNAGAGGDYLEVVEGFLAPAQELIAFQVAFNFNAGVAGERILLAEVVHHDRVVDDQLHWRQRIDLARLAAQVDHGVTHDGQVDDCGNAGEVLEQNPGGHEGDLLAGGCSGIPGGQRLDIAVADKILLAVAQQVFQQQFQRVGQGGGVAGSVQ